MYLIILSSTQRQHPDTNPLPALERYQGLYPSLLRSMQRKGIFLKRCDVVFVTAQGVIRAEEKVPLSDAPITPQLARSLHERNLETLRNILNSKKYDEIYVNLGHNYLQSIEGFDKSTNAKITHATGVLGRKAVHMKRWLQEHAQ